MVIPIIKQTRYDKSGIARRTTYAYRNTVEYRAWKAMRTRANNPNIIGAYNWSGRGITVCPEWDDFFVFLSDVGKKPTGKHTLERVDNELGYSADNCVWATRKEQSNNTRHNHLLTLNGITKTMMQWSEATGINYSCLRNRIRRGWSDEKALTHSVRATH